MESYDYTKEAEYINKIQTRIDTLSNIEAKHVDKFIDSIKEKSIQEQTSKVLSWFELAIVPYIREFAEMTSSRLTIETTDTIMIATLESQYGFDLNEDYKVMKNIISLANHIGIDDKDGNISLSLIFYCIAK